MVKIPKISIIIPSYNSEKYLTDTLESIFTQKYPNIEVIIQDGGSSDRSVEIIKKYSKKHQDKLIWVSRKDKGQLDAINKGFKKASGEILTYINTDDVYKKEAFQEVAKRFSRNKHLMWLAGKGNIIDKNGNEIADWVTQYKNMLLKLNNRNILLTVNYLMQPSVFISKNTFEKFGPFTGMGRWIMEYDMWLNLAKQEMPEVVDKTLSSFRITGNNVSFKEYSRILQADEKIFEKHSSNKLLFLFHNLHNIARIITAYIMNNAK